MQTVLITGGTGLVGKHLSTYLVSQGFKVIILTRTPPAQEKQSGISYAAWDTNKGEIDLPAIQAADYIIHLAGAPVMDKRWTPAYKKEILQSRTQSSLLLTKTLANNPHHVKAIISSSAIGWYGPDRSPGYVFTEEDPATSDFLGQTCVQWERSIETAKQHGIRVCKLRTGIVLAKEGGALGEFIKPLKLGVATILGNGKQVTSWIHVDDLCRMFHHAMVKELDGSYNAVAPAPVTNETLVVTLARILRNKLYAPLHVPITVLKLMLGERSVEILKSTTVSATKIMDTGFDFSYPDIKKALKQITTEMK